MQLNEKVMYKGVLVEANRTNLPETVLCRIKYPVCDIGIKNANNRIYEKAVWDKVLSNPELQEKIKNRNLFGHAEHPTETQSNLERVSHCVVETKIEGNKLFQTFDVVDTPTGRIVDSLLRADCLVGVSTRAEGDLEEKTEKGNSYYRVIPESFKYSTTDFTADPSTACALPVDIKRNVVSTARRELANEKANASDKQFATLLLESMVCKDKSKCQHCGCCEESINEGLESHVDRILDAVGIVKGKDYEWNNGMVIKNQKIKDKIVNLLNATGVFADANYDDKSNKVLFGKIGENKKENKVIDKVNEASYIDVSAAPDHGDVEISGQVDNVTIKPEASPIPKAVCVHIETNLLTKEETKPETIVPEQSIEPKEEKVEEEVPEEEIEPEEDEIEEKKVEDVPLKLRTDAFNRVLDMIDKGYGESEIKTQIEASQNILDKEQKEFLYTYKAKKVSEAVVQVTILSDITSQAVPVEPEIAEEDLKGGLSDRPVDKSKPNIDPDQLEIGIKVEMEHTKDREIAKKIAMDHLTEDPVYYTKLQKMETGACDKEVEESKLIETHNFAKGNVVKDKNDKYYVVKEASAFGIFLEPTDIGVDIPVFVPKEKIDGMGLVKVEESILETVSIIESEAIKKMYKKAGLPAPKGKGEHTMAFHKLAIEVAKGYVKGSKNKKPMSPEKALELAYPTTMEQLGKEKAVKKEHRRKKNESKESWFYKAVLDLRTDFEFNELVDKYGPNSNEVIQYVTKFLGEDAAKGRIEDIIRLVTKEIPEENESKITEAVAINLWGHISPEELQSMSAEELKDQIDDWKGFLEEYKEAEEPEIVSKIEAILKRLEAELVNKNKLDTAKESISSVAKQITNLRIQEACTRAERDKAVEELQESGDAQLKSKMLFGKVKITTEGLNKSNDEVYGLRNILEDKVESASKESARTLEYIEFLKKQIADLESEMKNIKEKHKKLHDLIDQAKVDLTTKESTLKNEFAKQLQEARAKAILEGKQDLLKEYFDILLNEHNLKAHKNTQALLEKCEDIQAVNRLMENLIDVSRRGALHSASINGLEVPKQPALTPDEEWATRMVESVGNGLLGKRN